MATTDHTHHTTHTRDDEGPGLIPWIIAFAVAGCFVWILAGR